MRIGVTDVKRHFMSSSRSSSKLLFLRLLSSLHPGAARRNKETKGAKDSQVQEIVTKWQKGSSDRDGGRQRRQ